MQFIIVAICHELFTLYHLRNLSLCSRNSIQCFMSFFVVVFIFISVNAFCPAYYHWIVRVLCMQKWYVVRAQKLIASTHTHAQCTCAFTQMFIIYNQRIPIFSPKKCPSDNGNNTTINILNLLRPHSTELMAVSFMLSLYFIYIYWSGCDVAVVFFHPDGITLLKVSGVNSLNTHLTHFRYKHSVFFLVLFWEKASFDGNQKSMLTVYFNECDNNMHLCVFLVDAIANRTCMRATNAHYIFYLCLTNGLQFIVPVAHVGCAPTFIRDVMWHRHKSVVTSR